MPKLKCAHTRTPLWQIGEAGQRIRIRRPEETAMRKVIALALALLAATTLTAFAQSYPSRNITIIVPYPAGGPTDTIARILAGRLQGALGQSVIIENIGGGRVAHATPDGYTLSIGHTQTHVFNPSILKLDYDVVTDFAPISLIADTPISIV